MMTDQEIAEILLKMIQEDAKRPPLEQIRDLIEAGVIDDKGRFILGSKNKTKGSENKGGKNKTKHVEKNGPSDISSPRKGTGT
jgi:hypothetical protein